MKHFAKLRALIISLSLLVIAGCYHIEVQQGNILTPHDVSAIHNGMSEQEVIDILGAPVLQNIYVDSRKIYVYTMKSGHKKMEKRHLIISFQYGRVVGIDTNVLLTEADNLPNH